MNRFILAAVAGILASSVATAEGFGEADLSGDTTATAVILSF